MYSEYEITFVFGGGVRCVGGVSRHRAGNRNNTVDRLAIDNGCGGGSNHQHHISGTNPQWGQRMQGSVERPAVRAIPLKGQTRRLQSDRTRHNDWSRHGPQRLVQSRWHSASLSKDPAGVRACTRILFRWPWIRRHWTEHQALRLVNSHSAQRIYHRAPHVIEMTVWSSLV